MALSEHDDVGSPDWWLLRLGRKLEARQSKLTQWWNYFTGDHPLPQAPKRATDAFKDFQRKARSNFCGEIANSSVNRLKVIGVADAAGAPDDDAWRWWELNRMQARQKVLWRAALALSEAYVMVGWHPDDTSRPLATIEHPSEVITEDDPATGEPIAALKAYYDDRFGIGRATLMLGPDVTIKYTTEQRRAGRLPWTWQAWDLDAASSFHHDLGRPPVEPFRCQPFLKEDLEPEFGSVIDIQDRINLGILNRMTAERYTAWRQKWVKGHKFDKVIDPATGLEVPVQPFVPDPGAIWASEFDDTQFGEFGQTMLGDYMKAHEVDIRDLLVISRTPAYTYAGDLVNVGSDTIQALDSSHVAKVEEHQGEFSEGLKAVTTLMARVAGIDRDYTQAVIRWSDPRNFNPAVAADAAVKKKNIGYPLSILAEDMGESPQRVRRITSEAAADQLLGMQALRLANDSAGVAAAATPGLNELQDAGTGGDGSA